MNEVDVGDEDGGDKDGDDDSCRNRHHHLHRHHRHSHHRHHRHRRRHHNRHNRDVDDVVEVFLYDEYHPVMEKFEIIIELIFFVSNHIHPVLQSWTKYFTEFTNSLVPHKIKLVYSIHKKPN